MYSKLGVNIKSLRKAFGETQSDLLFAIGMEGSSPSTISQYETGERVPERDTLIKIAKHYRITEDELINIDFSQIKNISKLIVNDKTKNKEAIDAYFPLVVNSSALENSFFEQAFRIHLELYDEIVVGKELEIDKLDKCLDLYEKAEKAQILEASANIIWWHMLISFMFAFVTPELVENLYVFKKNKIIMKEAMKYGFLPSFEEEQTQETKEYDESRKEFNKETSIKILAKIYVLKHSKEYSQLGDYYLALRHKFGLTTSSTSFEMESSIGDTMMYDFALMDNPYAKKFLNIQ